MPVETELYDTLEIAPDATTGEVKKAYHKLALVYHPDKPTGDEEKFKKILSAYKILSSPEERQKYDQFGKNGLRDSPGLSPDILSSLFGDSPFGNLFTMFNGMRNATKRPTQVVYKREVTLEELCTRKIIKIKVTRDRACECQKNSSPKTCKFCKGNGMTHSVRCIRPGVYQQMNHLCQECNGKGKIFISCGECKNGSIQDPKIFHLHLTPDMPHGYQYKFSGEGNEEPGQLPGDFVVIISYKPHEQFTVHGKDLIYTRTTPLKEALCGYSALVVHPSGENVFIQSETGIVIDPTYKITMKGKGLDSAGNLIVHHSIVFPKTLTEKQVEKLSKILA